ncbi:MAG: hypothetical protein LBK82_12650 [Planctomycetaceae bacterium]|jgi:hypothetical protein|nr:hypothetical protein [Planctomycetaceae bacterium]
MKKLLSQIIAVITFSVALTAGTSAMVYAAISDEKFVELINADEPDADKIGEELDAGANVNATLGDLPAIYYAINRSQSSGDTSIVKILVAHKVDANVKVNGSPLLHAVLWGLDEEVSAKTAQEIISLLIKAGADVNAVDEDGNSPAKILEENELPYSAQLTKILREAKTGGKIKKTDEKKTDEKKKPIGIKLNLPKLSAELPVGWNAKTDKETGTITLLSKKANSGVVINFSASDGTSSNEEWKDAFFSEFDLAEADDAKLQRGGFYKATFTQKDEEGDDVECYVLTGAKGELADTLLILGNDKHPELHQLLRSIKLKEERPLFDKMVATITGNAKPTKPTKPTPKKPTPPKPVPKEPIKFTKKTFPEFTIEIPNGWKSEKEEQIGMVSISSPDSMATLAILLAEGVGEMESKEFMDSILATFPFSKTAEPVKAGYYKSSFVTPVKVKGSILAGAKDGLADSIIVVGDKPELLKMIRSIKAKTERPYLDAMIKDSTKATEKKENKKEQTDDEEENEGNDEDDTGNNSGDDEEEEKPTTKKPRVIKTALQSSDLEKYKVNFALQEIKDPQLNNELAVTVAVPEGWRFKDQNIVQWNPITYCDPASVAFTLNGQEDETQCELLSSRSFHYDYGMLSMAKFLYQQEMQIYQQALQLSRQTGVAMPELKRPQIQEYKEHAPSDGRIVKQPLSAEDFIKWLINQDKNITNIKIQKVEKPKLIVAELQKALPELNKQLSALLRQSGSTMQFNGLTADTASVEFTCSKDGKRYEQRIGVIITYLRIASPCNVITKANDESVTWTVQLSSAYALEGKLKDHESEIAIIMGESKINPIWKAKVDYLVAETIRKIAEANLKTQEEIQRQMIETQNYVSKTHQEVFRNRSNAMSNVSTGWSNVLTGKEIVNLPDGSKYRVPIGVFNSNNLPAGSRISNY